MIVGKVEHLEVAAPASFSHTVVFVGLGSVGSYQTLLSLSSFTLFH